MATAPTLDGRRAARDIVSFRAALDAPGAGRASILLVDMSPLGFMSRTTATLAAGDVVAVRLPHLGPRAARIVWSLGGRVGGEFVEPIPPAAYARVLAASPHDAAGSDTY